MGTTKIVAAVVGLLLAAVFVYIVITGANSPQQERIAVTVGVYNNHPKVFVDDDGDPKGIFIDILRSISHAENLDLQFRQGDWSTLYAELKVGNIDILPDVAYSEERDSLFVLSVPVIGSWLQVFDDGEDSFSSVTELDGKRIGVLDESIQEACMEGFVKAQFNIDFELMA